MKRACALVFGVLAIFLLGWPRSGPAQTLDPDARLASAIADYAAAQSETDREARLAGFQRAERGFATLVESGIETPALYTNAGNAAYQAGRIGEAVLAWRRAQALDPEAVTARQNLAHVRAKLPSWVPRPGEQSGGPALLAYRRIPQTTRALAAAGCFAGAALALLVAGRRREGPYRGLAILLGAAWLGLLASVHLDRGDGASRAAVLMADETAARSSDSALAPLAFPDPLPPGVEVELLEQRGELARVRLANGRDVWVAGTSVMQVAR